jgi:uncharacterized protein with NAD-binding domain and iron-sulfur cluster
VREKVAVLGGGIAGLTAALELSATPELRAQYEVTLYQLGWRCGGKCATGRNVANGSRVEEHGLHLWFGGYDNAFSVLADCYRELDRPPGHPIATMDDAWSPLSSVVLYDNYGGRWSHVYRTFDIEPGRPWDSVEVPRFWDLLANVLHTVEARISWLRSESAGRMSASRVGPVGRVLRPVGDWLERLIVRIAVVVAEWHHRHRPTGRASRRRAHPVAWLLAQVRDHSWRRHVCDHLGEDAIRHSFSELDMMLTSMIGILRDELLWNGFDSIDDLDFRDWLAKHGAQPTTLDGPDVRVVYDESFADSTGRVTTSTDMPRTNRDDRGAFAAGAALYGLVRTRLPYRGSVMWQANGGMGDTAIAPMYETLVKRGVDVKLFQKVTRLAVDRDRMVIDRIDVEQQATPIGTYQPLIDVKGLACWPNTPRWDLLERGADLAASGIDFEAGDSEPHAAMTPLVLGQDFDKVVLAISAAALPAICEEVMSASPAFKTMLDHTQTVMTQAFQLWLQTTPSDLGFPYGHTATTSFVEPVDTACDNSQLLWSEDWPAESTPKSVWYFCGVMDDVEGENDPAGPRDRAKAAALGYLDVIGAQWPGIVGPEGFRWDVLAAVAAEDDIAGPARFDTQYWRANATSTERYVQTIPGWTKYRLRADESGLHNLFLAGDWTRNGMNIGAVEATVMSGMQASRAICGSPKKIAWDGHAWLVGA